MVTDLDTVLQKIVGFGKYQILSLLLLSLTGFGVAFHNLIHVFTGNLPPYLCSDFIHLQLNSSRPASQIFYESDDGVLHTFSINVYDRSETEMIFVNTSDRKTLLRNISVSNVNCAGSFKLIGAVDTNESTNGQYSKCSSWAFDRCIYESTVGTEWSLVCEKTWLLPLMQSLHMIGALIGALLGGIAADRFGRRPTLLVAVVMELTSGIATAFAPNLAVYGLLRLVAGIAVSTLYNAVLITAVEIVTPRWRLFVGTSLLYVNALGIMLLALLAYLIRSWRTLQLVASSLLMVHLLYFWAIPESPRWLLLKGRHFAATAHLRRMCQINGRSWPEEVELSRPISTQHKSSITDLIKSPKLRWRTIKISVIWLGLCIAYYGLSLYTSELDGDDFVNFLISGIVEVPALTFAILADRKFGRRTLLAVPLACAGITLLVVAPIPDSMAWMRVTLAMTGKLGLSAAYTTIYSFTVELFPTCLRSNGLGVSSVSAKIGGLVAPFISLLSVHGRMIPLLLCGALAFFSCGLVLLLPETSHLPLTETVAEAERSSVSETLFSQLCFRATGESAEVKKQSSQRQEEVLVGAMPNTKLLDTPEQQEA